MGHRFTRRHLIAAGAGACLGATVTAGLALTDPEWSYPVSRNGGLPGDGFFIKHGYACENAAYYPGLSHTGENWYGSEQNAAGADVIAVAAGNVVYADYDYPGHVVIVEHAEHLYSVYGHMDYELSVAVGEAVVRGQKLGTVLARSDDYERSHLHFEIRTFLINDFVNGDRPSYGFTCGYQCPPGPGYWPLGAPEHPSDLGWLNPTHVIARRTRSTDLSAIVSTRLAVDRLPTWSDLPWRQGSRELAGLFVEPGDHFLVAQIKAGTETARGRDAHGYRLWYRLALPSGELVWMNALTPDGTDRNLDGSPSGVRFNLIPSAQSVDQ
jgi:hypothetical protein